MLSTSHVEYDTHVQPTRPNADEPLVKLPKAMQRLPFFLFRS